MAAVIGLGSHEAGPSPQGFVRTPSAGTADLRWTDGRWAVLPEVPAGELRSLRGLRVRWPEDAEQGARSLPGLLDLAAAGVPLHAEEVPSWAVRADPVLAELLADGGWLAETSQATPRCTADLRREEHSVRLRRHGLAHRRRAGGDRTGTPKVSVVMSSMRPHLLETALAQIARQRGVETEVLLGLHGVPAGHEAVRRALGSCPLPVTVVEAGAATPFGEVLNLAAALASGDYVAKWDDDDWYGPEHLSDLLLARSYSGADIVGTAAEFFYLEPLDVTVRRTDYTSEVWSDHVAGGTILLDRERFRRSGGFPALSAGVDAAFLKAAGSAGARIYRTHGLGYVLRRSAGAEHTWRLPLAHFLRVASNQWRGFRPSLILEMS
ncbi:glycosyltransferase family 2 protein [Planomonospora sp. ID67723]|uniref:glycosyltransferase family 2 protein n=1 Tax=Planomonospora sp. ID67723 TaxID=2738134 RepID=UPI0018C4500E|nr:glycosyltransferase family 2 protein [Planomonospora sp. ID67723]MBG0828309.1 glycosyltransferase family 2 protein [Planomonospora sp. ID67723]